MKINGKEYAFDSMTARQLIERLDLKQERLVLEVCGEIIAKEQFESFIVTENATVEIVSFVGGG